MIFHKIADLKEYTLKLESDTSELKALFDDVLIHVTGFFRDQEVFNFLKETVFPNLILKKGENPIRIWVPGCSSGEEVYSIAISLLESLGSNKSLFQVFGTDISKNAIELARKGIYLPNQLEGLSEERLKRYFVKVNGNFQINKFIRDHCVFAIQNVINDPPFSRMDLVSCRNLLIYFGNSSQKKIIPTFHYALNPTGYLLLGASETIGSFTDLFIQVDKKNKLYSKNPSALRRHSGIPIGLMPRIFENNYHTVPTSTQDKNVELQPDIRNIAENFLLNHYVPCGVVINDFSEIIHVLGDTSHYLSLHEGSPTLNIYKMVQNELAIELRILIHRAFQDNKSVIKEGLIVKNNGELKCFDLEVIPLNVLQNNVNNLLILFKDTTLLQNNIKQSSKNNSSARTLALENELKKMKEATQSITEDFQSALEVQETSNEELKTANEEILSNNEELQSTIEELETAKEELQSTNEELITLNDELSNRNQEFNLLNRDLTHLLSSINKPIVMLDENLCIKHYTPKAETFFKFIPSDVGRPITDIQLKMALPNLEQDIQKVILHEASFEQEVQDLRGHWYLFQIKPFRTIVNKTEGAVLILIDIHPFKMAKDFANSILNTIRQPLLVLNKELYVVYANCNFYDTFGTDSKDTVSKLVYKVGNGQWDIPRLRSLLEEIIPKNNYFENYLVEHNFETIGLRTMILNGRRIVFESLGSEEMVLLCIEDITLRKRVENKLLESNLALEQFAFVVSHDLREPLRLISSYSQLLNRHYSVECVKGEEVSRREKGKDYLNYITGSAKKLDEMIREILMYSQLGSGNKNIKNTNTNKLIQESIQNLKFLIEETNTTITQDPLPDVYANEMQFILLFQNLISNAIKFRKKSEVPTIHISAIKKTSEILFSIKDNGIGIEESQFNRIFKIFQKLNPESQYTGTGIGLATCKKIVENLNGKIWVESEPLVGSTFFFTMPL